MITKNGILTTTSIISILIIASSGSLNQIFAEEGYSMAENVKAQFTFTFRDGVENHQFPVFKMTSDFVKNDGTTFEVEGIVGDSPYLHKAIDEAFKYRMMTSTGASSFEYDYRFFDIDVTLTRDSQIIRTLEYYNCEILDFEVITLKSNDYESYTSSKSGFALVDKIEFRCGGVNGDYNNSSSVQKIDYAETYTFVEGVRTFITFEFDKGTERIEFTSFELNSAFEESDDAVVPNFSVQGVVDSYPLLYEAIDNARKVSGLKTAFNTDFEALVEFSNGEKTLRALDFRDCRVSGAIINTEFDKEEGFTGKSGFAIVNEIDFECAGLKPLNPNYSKLQLDTPIRKNSFMTNSHLSETMNMAENLDVIAKFTFNNGIEQIKFPIFAQHDVLSKSNPKLVLEGIVGDYPLLYKRVDDNLKIQSVSGANLMTELFDIDIEIIKDDLIRGFNYSNCRVIDYDIGSAMNSEENYIKGLFALENSFTFECQGYHPNNPAYDRMFKTFVKSDSVSTKDLRTTHDWDPGFYVQ
ncbi:MAG: hypothetical protein R3237_02960 [Nitrosopumilaceae archaeon]|nr:hypothetical protein [Nitrosopumilaceae archaeon]